MLVSQENINQSTDRPARTKMFEENKAYKKKLVVDQIQQKIEKS